VSYSRGGISIDIYYENLISIVLGSRMGACRDHRSVESSYGKRCASPQDLASHITVLGFPKGWTLRSKPQSTFRLLLQSSQFGQQNPHVHISDPAIAEDQRIQGVLARTVFRGMLSDRQPTAPHQCARHRSVWSAAHIEESWNRS